jgi:hypothetical protein
MLALKRCASPSRFCKLCILHTIILSQFQMTNLNVVFLLSLIAVLCCRCFEIRETMHLPDDVTAYSIGNIFPCHILETQVENQLDEWRARLKKPAWGYPGLMYNFKPTDEFTLPSFVNTIVSELLGEIATSQHW